MLFLVNAPLNFLLYLKLQSKVNMVLLIYFGDYKFYFIYEEPSLLFMWTFNSPLLYDKIEIFLPVGYRTKRQEFKS